MLIRALLKSYTIWKMDSRVVCHVNIHRHMRDDLTALVPTLGQVKDSK